MATFPSGYRSFSTSFNDNKSQPVFNYVEDPNWVWTDNAGNLNTGAWRPLFPTDFNANIDITGLTVSVGAVAVTGAPVVTLTGVQNVNVTNPVLAVSGNLSASISSVGITGNVVANSGTFSPTFTGITSGQIQVPVGVKAYSIYVESGSSYVNGFLWNAGTNYGGGGYSNNYSLSTAINVGCTGGRVLVNWEI